MWQQTTTSSNTRLATLTGTANPWNGTVPAADFSKPIQVMIQWDTSSNQAWFYLDGVLQTTFPTEGAAQVGSTAYVYLQGFECGSYCSVQSILLTTAPSQVTTVLKDHFSYTTSNINGHAPDFGQGVWSADYSNGNISTSASTAVILTTVEYPAAAGL